MKSNATVPALFHCRSFGCETALSMMQYIPVHFARGKMLNDTERTDHAQAFEPQQWSRNHPPTFCPLLVKTCFMQLREPEFAFIVFVCLDSLTCSLLLTLIFLFLSLSPLSSACDCVSPTFRVSPLMCCCSLALPNWHVRTLARMESSGSRECVVLLLLFPFTYFFYLPPPALSFVLSVVPITLHMWPLSA